MSGWHYFFLATGVVFWTSIGITVFACVLRLIYEMVGATLFFLRLKRATKANFTQIRRPIYTWLDILCDDRTSVCFRNSGTIVRWPRPWYNAEADKEKSWNQQLVEVE